MINDGSVRQSRNPSGSMANSVNRPKSNSDGFEPEAANLCNVYMEEYGNLCAYARRLTRYESPEVQDIVQQAFVNTLAAIERGVEIHNMAAFLNRCVRNLVFENWRSENMRNERYVPFEGEITHRHERSLASRAEFGEQWQRLASVVEDLVPDQRRAFLLAEMRGLGYEEIASEMNRSPDSVRMLLTRARTRVRENVPAPSEWFGAAVPLQAKIWLDQAQHNSLVTWVKSKTLQTQSWFHSVVQQVSDSAVQPAVAVAATAVVIALASGGGVVLAPAPAPASMSEEGAAAHHMVSRSSEVGLVLEEPVVALPQVSNGSDRTGVDSGSSTARAETPVVEVTVPSDSGDKAAVPEDSTATEPSDDPKQASGGIAAPPVQAPYNPPAEGEGNGIPAPPVEAPYQPGDGGGDRRGSPSEPLQAPAPQRGDDRGQSAELPVSGDQPAPEKDTAEVPVPQDDQPDAVPGAAKKPAAAKLLPV